jgi:transcriptional/translational regulatory protein YebC/TACO1
MQTALEARGIQATSTGHEYVAQNLTELPEDKANEVMELVATLESDDDVQNVYTNLG